MVVMFWSGFEAGPILVSSRPTTDAESRLQVSPVFR